ncbi:hypothetical protein [Glycomyces sp. YM15]|uniref:hypothetical protein n=1 Tax=Glycomyces sp. YM15 TaxID=2800446 RepID=UPI0019652678|nr:hypothetical protein [Glycomyces sp. YM15]
MRRDSRIPIGPPFTHGVLLGDAAALIAARDAAQAAKDDEGATQEEADTAASGLADAIAELTKTWPL